MVRRISVLIVLAAALSACGANARQKALRTSLTALNTARDGFSQWDDQHQIGIVKKATSKDEGKAALAAYRTKRQPVIVGFMVAYSAFAAAALDDNTARIAEAAKAAAAVYKIIKEFRNAQAP